MKHFANNPDFIIKYGLLFNISLSWIIFKLKSIYTNKKDTLQANKTDKKNKYDADRNHRIDSFLKSSKV